MSESSRTRLRGVFFFEFLSFLLPPTTIVIVTYFILNEVVIIHSVLSESLINMWLGSFESFIYRY